MRECPKKKDKDGILRAVKEFRRGKEGDATEEKAFKNEALFQYSCD